MSKGDIGMFCIKCDNPAYAISFNWDAEGTFWALSLCGDTECDMSTNEGWLKITAQVQQQMIANQREDWSVNGYL